MPKVSRIKVDSEKLGFYLNNFWSVITLLENKEQVKYFLKALLTHTEMKMFAKRMQIAKMLIEGNTYNDIRNHVRVTDSTIARINNILETQGKGLKTAITFLQKIEKETEEKRMNATPDLKKKYGMYFLPEIIAEEVTRVRKSKSKKNSAKRKVAL
jgi:TrpR-related protein YerC/YecD